MATITIPDYTNQRRSAAAGPHRTRLAPERYYHILKAILEGYGKSNFYQFSVTQDPRPIQSVIARLSRIEYGRMVSDLNDMIRAGLVNCCVDERSSLFKKGKKSKKRKAIKTYEATEKGLQYITDYEENKINA